jgi:hypothetical protein
VDQIPLEGLSRSLPRVAQGLLAALAAIERKARQRGRSQILGQCAVDAVLDDVARSHDIVSCHWDAAGECLDDDKPESVGA